MHAPSRFTIFKWQPKFTIIFSSDTKASTTRGSFVGLIVFTATVVVVFGLIIPIAVPLKTTPKAPDPNCSSTEIITEMYMNSSR